MITKSPLEYVFSGCGHTRILSKPAYTNPDTREAIVEAFKRAQGMNNHTYSVLYNAHVESNFGPLIQDNYKYGFYKVHSDSGGLQIVTQGLDIDARMKRAVYENQGKFSDIAMSFDEIPVILTGETSNRNDVNNRLFDDANFEEFARQTGLNVREQLEYFAETGNTTTKPLIIIQGNCVDSYCRWAEIIMNEIPDELVQGIGGVSLGAAGLGTGTLEDIERMFSLNELPMPDEVKNTLHILGVGSARRLMPAITFRNNGRLDGVHISYDSTTHSSGLSLGSYYCDERMTLIKMRKQNFAKIHERICKLTGRDMNPDIVWEALHTNNTDFAERFPEYNTDRFTTFVGFLLASITNFTKVVNDIETDERKFNQFIDSRKLTHYHSLKSVKTRDDFDHWMREVGRHIKSARVQKASDADSNLGDFL